MKRLFDNVRSTLIWVIALPFFFVSCMLILVVSLFTRGPKFDSVIKF